MAPPASAGATRRSPLPSPYVLAAVAGVLAVGAIVVLLALVLGTLSDVRETLRTTNAELRQTQARVDAVRGRVEPIVSETRGSRRGTRAIERTTTATLPEISGDVQLLSSAVVPLVGALRGAQLAGVLEDVGALARRADAVLARPALQQLLTDGAETLRRAGRLDLLADADRALEDVPRVRGDVRRVDEHVVVLLARITAVLQTLERSRQVQCVILAHTESIDRRLGGTSGSLDARDRPADAAAQCPEHGDG